VTLLGHRVEIFILLQEQGLQMRLAKSPSLEYKEKLKLVVEWKLRVLCKRVASFSLEGLITLELNR